MRRTRARALAVSVLLAFAGPALACSDDDALVVPDPTEAPETATTQDPGPVEGGTLTVASFAAPTSLDPTVAAGGGATGGIEMAAIYDTLIRWDPVTATYVPRTALAVEPNADATQWTIRVRPEVLFTDGTAYDAAAVKAGLDRHRSPLNRTPSAAHMARVSDVAVVDALTVVVSLTEPWPGFIAVLAD
jgi:peptide/nickel transport system substrate-binding protein